MNHDLSCPLCAPDLFVDLGFSSWPDVPREPELDRLLVPPPIRLVYQRKRKRREVYIPPDVRADRRFAGR